MVKLSKLWIFSIILILIIGSQLHQLNVKTATAEEFQSKSFSRFPFYIFQIGAHKCGTRSISSFFKRNNISSIHWKKNGRYVRDVMYQRYIANKPLLTEYYANQYMLYTDMSANQKFYSNNSNTNVYMHELLSKQYSNAKFILNIRPVFHYLKSKYFHHSPTKHCYIVDCYNCCNKTHYQIIQKWKKYWYKYICDVINYFDTKNMSDNLLILDIENDSIDKLIQFFNVFNLTLDVKHWKHSGRSRRTIYNDTQYSKDMEFLKQIEKWEDIVDVIKYPERVHELNMDNHTEYYHITNHCKSDIFN